MLTKYYVVVEIRNMNDDKIIGSGSCQCEDLNPKSISDAASIAGRYAEGKELATYDEREKIK